MAYDSDTQSHWAVAYHANASFSLVNGGAYVARVGYTGGAVEQATLFNNSGRMRGFAPSACFNPDASEFPIVYPSTTPRCS